MDSRQSSGVPWVVMPRHVVADERGAAGIEYVAAIAVMALMALGGTQTFGSSVAATSNASAVAVHDFRSEAPTAAGTRQGATTMAQGLVEARPVGAGLAAGTTKAAQAWRGTGLRLVLPPSVPASPIPHENNPLFAAHIGNVASPGTPTREALLDELGPAVGVRTQIPAEVPYRYPPEIHITTRKQPMDFGALTKGQSYLWAVGPKGEFLYAPEDQREPSPTGLLHTFATTESKPEGRRVKHGDLFPSPDGSRRDVARIGGELHAERDDTGAFTGRWLLNNQSSYSGPKARLDNKAQNLPALETTKRLLERQGVDVRGLVLDPFIPKPRPEAESPAVAATDGLPARGRTMRGRGPAVDVAAGVLVQ